MVAPAPLTPLPISPGPEMMPAPAPVSMAAPAEDPTSILGLEKPTVVEKSKTPEATLAEQNKGGPVLTTIEDHPIPPATGAEVLEAIAKTELSEEKKPETTNPEAPVEAATTITTELKPDEAQEEKPQTEASPEALQRHEEVRKQLKELGELLLQAKDMRATLVSLSLAAGDTPIGNEFREETLRSILNGGRLSAVEEARWSEMQHNQPEPKDIKDTELGKFFIRHSYPKEFLEQFGQQFAPGIEQVLNQKDKKKLTPVAQDLRREFGWDDKHPMPKDPSELAKQFGDEHASVNTALIKDIDIKEKIDAWKGKIRGLTGKAPAGIYFMFVALGFVQQMFDGTESRGGGH